MRKFCRYAFLSKFPVICFFAYLFANFSQSFAVFMYQSHYFVSDIHNKYYNFTCNIFLFMYKCLYIKINTIYMDKLLSCMHLIKKTAAKIFNLFLKPTNLSDIAKYNTSEPLVSAFFDICHNLVYVFRCFLRKFKS